MPACEPMEEQMLRASEWRGLRPVKQDQVCTRVGATQLVPLATAVPLASRRVSEKVTHTTQGREG